MDERSLHLPPPVAVPGLDAATPLGFLAALGLLAILDEGAQAAPRLYFREEGGVHPALIVPEAASTDASDTVIEAVQRDVSRWREASVLRFRYVKPGKSEPFGGLTPPVAVLRGWLNDRLAAGDDIAIEYACALFAEAATVAIDERCVTSDLLQELRIPFDPDAPLDRACQQTPFDFSSRNMQFLDQVERIRRTVEDHPEWLRPALFSGEPVREDTRAMGWDTNAKVPYAQYSSRTVARYPVAEWLAFRGLACLPVFARGQRMAATACRGRRLAGSFIWPVWTARATLASTRSLLAYPDLERLRSAELRALGVAQVFRAGFTKLGQYDAIFTPTEPLGGPGFPRGADGVVRPRLAHDRPREPRGTSIDTTQQVSRGPDSAAEPLLSPKQIPVPETTISETATSVARADEGGGAVDWSFDSWTRSSRSKPSG